MIKIETFDYENNNLVPVNQQSQSPTPITKLMHPDSASNHVKNSQSQMVNQISNQGDLISSLVATPKKAAVVIEVNDQSDSHHPKRIIGSNLKLPEIVIDRQNTKVKQRDSIQVSQAGETDNSVGFKNNNLQLNRYKTNIMKQKDLQKQSSKVRKVDSTKNLYIEEQLEPMDEDMKDQSSFTTFRTEIFTSDDEEVVQNYYADLPNYKDVKINQDKLLETQRSSLSGQLEEHKQQIQFKFQKAAMIKQSTDKSDKVVDSLNFGNIASCFEGMSRQIGSNTASNLQLSSNNINQELHMRKNSHVQSIQKNNKNSYKTGATLIRTKEQPHRPHEDHTASQANKGCKHHNQNQMRYLRQATYSILNDQKLIMKLKLQMNRRRPSQRGNQQRKLPNKQCKSDRAYKRVSNLKIMCQACQQEVGLKKSEMLKSQSVSQIGDNEIGKLSKFHYNQTIKDGKLTRNHSQVDNIEISKSVVDQDLMNQPIPILELNQIPSKPHKREQTVDGNHNVQFLKVHDQSTNHLSITPPQHQQSLKKQLSKVHKIIKRENKSQINPNLHLRLQTFAVKQDYSESKSSSDNNQKDNKDNQNEIKQQIIVPEGKNIFLTQAKGSQTDDLSKSKTDDNEDKSKQFDKSQTNFNQTEEERDVVIDTSLNNRSETTSPDQAQINKQVTSKFKIKKIKVPNDQTNQVPLLNLKKLNKNYQSDRQLLSSQRQDENKGLASQIIHSNNKTRSFSKLVNANRDQGRSTQLLSPDVKGSLEVSSQLRMLGNNLRDTLKKDSNNDKGNPEDTPKMVNDQMRKLFENDEEEENLKNNTQYMKQFISLGLAPDSNQQNQNQSPQQQQSLQSTQNYNRNISRETNNIGGDDVSEVYDIYRKDEQSIDVDNIDKNLLFQMRKYSNVPRDLQIKLMEQRHDQQKRKSVVKNTLVEQRRISKLTNQMRKNGDNSRRPSYLITNANQEEKKESKTPGQGEHSPQKSYNHIYGNSPNLNDHQQLYDKQNQGGSQPINNQFQQPQTAGVQNQASHLDGNFAQMQYMQQMQMQMNFQMQYLQSMQQQAQGNPQQQQLVQQQQQQFMMQQMAQMQQMAMMTQMGQGMGVQNQTNTINMPQMSQFPLMGMPFIGGGQMPQLNVMPLATPSASQPLQQQFINHNKDPSFNTYLNAQQVQSSNIGQPQLNLVKKNQKKEGVNEEQQSQSSNGFLSNHRMSNQINNGLGATPDKKDRRNVELRNHHSLISNRSAISTFTQIQHYQDRNKEWKRNNSVMRAPSKDPNGETQTSILNQKDRIQVNKMRRKVKREFTTTLLSQLNHEEIDNISQRMNQRRSFLLEKKKQKDLLKQQEASELSRMSALPHF